MVSGVIVGLKTTERGMNISPPTAGPSAANSATMPIIGIKKGRPGSVINRSSCRNFESLRDLLQAGANQRGGLSVVPQLSRDPGDRGGGLRMGVAKANESEDRVFGRP